MCERIPTVERLAAWERQGVRDRQPPGGRSATPTASGRSRALRAAACRFPESVLVEHVGAGATGEGPAFPCWVKRGDVHATQEGDVSCADDPAALVGGARAPVRARHRARRRAGARARRPDQVLRGRRARRRPSRSPGSSGSTTAIRSSPTIRSTHGQLRALVGARRRGPRPRGLRRRRDRRPGRRASS